MTYDEFRLWKHKQKVAKERMKTPYLPAEPEFKSYQEYQEWRFKQKE